MKQIENKEVRILIRVEPAALARYDRIAEEFFGGNRSELVRRAVEDLVGRKEREVAEASARSESQAA